MLNIMNIGVLACQGAFAEHLVALKHVVQDLELSFHLVEVRDSSQLDSDLRGLIIPGGESTTLNIFFGQEAFLSKLKQWMCSTNPPPVVWGTCAGLIVLSDQVEHEKTGGQLEIGGLAVTTSRNFFGRQNKSFEQKLDLLTEDLVECYPYDKSPNFPGIFIRAPGIQAIKPSQNVRVLAELRGYPGLPNPSAVAVEQGSLMACSFHPELSKDLRFHAYFVRKVLKSSLPGKLSMKVYINEKWPKIL
ncbi:hypothetical protein TCAL_03067 [Tigriopus californicus]|uniref:glutaminase n=2 Tax=Tigriopus californicus TaxID=6832 RepID=A0A553NTP0_TIGCA|nr:hypothetical protein TCAL_03067 [Tigriopus californicus]